MSIDYYLKGSPPWPLCELFKAAAMDSWERIRFSRTIPNLKIHETTITQNLIYELKLLQRVGRVKGLRIQEAKNERTNGADLELFLVKNGKAIRFALQAKIIYHKGKKKHHNGDYRQMHHTVKKSGKHQIDLLLRYAKAKKCVPLYLMYNYVSVVFPAVAEMKHYGCTVVSAEFLKADWQDSTGNLRDDVHFLNLHAVPKTLKKPAFPWHELICSDWATDIPGILTELGMDPATDIIELTIEELLEDESFTELTDGLTLTPVQKSRKTRNREQYIEDLPTFAPKFRLIVDVSPVRQ